MGSTTDQKPPNLNQLRCVCCPSAFCRGLHAFRRPRFCIALPITTVKACAPPVRRWRPRSHSNALRQAGQHVSRWRPARLRGPMDQLTTRPNRPCGAAARRQLIQHLVGGAEEVPLTRLNAFPLEARCFHIAMSRNATKPVGTSPEKVGHPSPQLMWREDSLAGTQRSVPACAPGRPANATIVLDQGSATSVSTPSATFP